MNKSIYLDHAATEPLRPEALAAMMPYLTERYGNPSAAYALGREAQKALEDARAKIAKILRCQPGEIVFTSGGTESVNLALRGVALAQRDAGVGRHIVTSVIEHHAVLHTAQRLEEAGFEVGYVQSDGYGLIAAADVASAVGPDTVLVSVMTANNEVGAIEPIAEIAAAVRRRSEELGRRIPIHTDAVQAPNSMAVDVESLGVDLLSLSAHKFGGPKGVGVLYLRRGTPFAAQQTGGGQERQRRAGTENVAGAVGAARALEVAQAEREGYSRHCGRLRDRLLTGLRRRLPSLRLNGHPDRRLPNNLNVSFEGAEARRILEALDERGIAASAGSACDTSTFEPSHVLLALGVPMAAAVASVRFTLGLENTEDDIDAVCDLLAEIVPKAANRLPA